MDPRAWGAAEWGAFGQVGALVVAVVAGVLVWLQVRQGKQVREDQTRPYVILDFDFQAEEVMIAVRNIGTTPARDVRFKFDKPLRPPHYIEEEALAVFTDGIPMLAPGRTIGIPFGSALQFFSDEGDPVPLQYTARLTYESLDSKRTYEDPPLVIDLLPFKHTYVQYDELRRISRNLKEIKDVLKSWTSEQRLRVNTVTQGEVDERHRQRREVLEQRRREAEETTPPEDAAE